MIELGTTFWGGLPGDVNGKHLWFVISDPNRNSGSVVIVNMTTRRPGSDSSCVLRPGDHPGVDHESTINYLKARNVPIANILAGQKRRPDCIMFAQKASTELVSRILEGALRSDYASSECRRIASSELRELLSSTA